MGKSPSPVVVRPALRQDANLDQHSQDLMQACLLTLNPERMQTGPIFNQLSHDFKTS